MCGIVGYVGKEHAVQFMIEGLSKLEYRGYDSAGVALLDNKRKLHIFKKEGKLKNLTDTLDFSIKSDIGLGHTRWATHGVPSDMNAHPHTDCNGHITVVHNGIIENFAMIKDKLSKDGHKFDSETDTEVIAHLIEKYYKGNLPQAVKKALSERQGSFALAVMCDSNPDLLVAAKKDSPMIIGLGNGENYIASDIPAVLGRTKQVYILEDYDFVIMTANNVEITNWKNGTRVTREVMQISWDAVAAEKAGYEHFMLKEIHEQPKALRDTMQGHMRDGLINLSDLGLSKDFENISKIYIVGCGTAYHAGLVGRIAIEKLVKIPVETDIASEFQYRDVIWEKNSLMIIISQSGETADTMSALRKAKEHGIRVLAVTNVVGSAAAREADRVIYTHAGPEIAVASTKAYSTQLLIMYMIALDMARVRKTLSDEILALYSQELMQIDRLTILALEQEESIKRMANNYKKIDSAFFLGRGFDYAVAMEGALKLKEISYIHAEAYAAGELKHGPLALITPDVLVISLMTQDTLLTSKTASNISEVVTRGGKVIAIGTEDTDFSAVKYNEKLVLPSVASLIAPIVSVVPLQLFSYYMAVNRGLDVDKPRNLAKSVTVE